MLTLSKAAIKCVCMVLDDLITRFSHNFPSCRDAVGNVVEIEAAAGEKEESPYFNCWIKALVDGVCMLVKEGGTDGRIFHLLSQRYVCVCLYFCFIF